MSPTARITIVVLLSLCSLINLISLTEGFSVPFGLASKGTGVRRFTQHTYHTRRFRRAIVPQAGGGSSLDDVDPSASDDADSGPTIIFSSPDKSPAGSSAAVAIPTSAPNVGAPQRSPSKSYSIDSIMKELALINNSTPSKISILGTRHCSYLHQTIIELLAYALVLSGNHVFTSGAGGTNAAAIRGALRAKDDGLLTVILPQSLEKQSAESRELLSKVTDVITLPENDSLTLDAASRLCNSELLSRTDQLISFAFHDSGTVLECVREAEEIGKIVTVLYLD